MTKSIAELSVVIPCYQCTDTIERAVESIAVQSMGVAEVLLVDDCSPDDTLEFLKKLQSFYAEGWIKVIALPENQGPGSARNAGWKLSTQPYVAFLDSDDAWHPQKVEIQYQWMKVHPQAVLTGHLHRRLTVNEEDSLINTESLSPPRYVTGKMLLLKNEFPTRSVMVQKQIKQRFVEGQYYCEDYLLWLRIALSDQACYKFDLPLAYVFKNDYGERGLASNLWKMERGELFSYSYLKKQNLIAGWQQVFYSTFSLLKYLKRRLSVILRGGR